MKTRLTILVLMIISSIYSKGTNVSGALNVNTTWTLLGSPYIVTSSVTLNNGMTLTIQPGVVVKFHAGTDIGCYSGTIIAQGTITDSITFTSNLANPHQGDWMGIYMHNSGNLSSKFNFCTIKYGKFGFLDYNSISDTLYIKNSTFKYDSIGVYNVVSHPVNSYSCYVDSCTFNTTYWGFYDFLGTAIITNSSFINNNTGIYNTFITDYPGISINQCSFQHNLTGIFSSYPSNPYLTINNCSVKFNQTGINSNYCTIKNCIVDSNQTGIQFTSLDSIYNCEINSNGIGLLIAPTFNEGSYNQIINNIIEFDSIGIYAVDIERSSYYRNQIKHNKIGASLNYSINYSNFNNNDIEYDSIGIKFNLSGTVRNVTFNCNKICNNSAFSIQNFNDTVNMQNNYWCGNDSALISHTIIDSNGVISFMPTDTIGCYIPGCNLQASINANYASCDTCHDGQSNFNVINGIPPYTYIWNTNPVQTTQNAFNLAPGTYQVCATDANGCIICDSVTVGNNIILGIINNSSLSNRIILIPNPASTIITIHTPYMSSSQLLITDMLGNSISQQTLSTQDTKLDVSKWSNGIYFYEVRGSGLQIPTSTRGKFVVQH